MRAYAMDLRERVLAALDAGMSYDEASMTFQIHRATVGRWRQRQRDTGACVPRPIPGRPRTVADDLDAGIVALVAAQPDATLAELTVQWNATHATPVSPSSVSRALRRTDVRRKKRV